MRRLAPIAVLTSVGACGLSVVGIAPNEEVDGAEGGARDDAAFDSAFDSTFDSAFDSSFDAPNTMDDGATPIDASSDAPSGIDSGTTFCDTLGSVPQVCADFDEGSITAGWDGTTLDAGVTLAPSTTVFKSGPSSFHASSTQGKPAALRKTLTVTTTLSIDYDVRYVAIPTSGDVSTVLLTPPTFPGYDVYFFVGGTTSYFQQYGDDYSTMRAAPTVNVWHHVQITLTLGSATTITATFDGTDYWNNHTLLHTWPKPATATIEVGLASLYQVTTSEAFIDNVVIRAQ